MTNPIQLIQTLRKANRPDITIEQALNENMLLSGWMDSLKAPMFAVYAILLGGECHNRLSQGRVHRNCSDSGCSVHACYVSGSSGSGIQADDRQY